VTISPFNAYLGLGKHQRFTAFVAGVNVAWSLSGGGFISRSGVYYAPLRLPAVPTVRVMATDGLANAEATVQLTSRPADPADCFAEGQSTDPRDFVFVEELPEAIVRVAPSYPDSAREAGVEGTVMVSAHVCACGEVDDTRMVVSIPMLDSAAAGAVRQWMFKPALTGGEPVAVWVSVPIKFSLH
jgi:protein TonB